MEAARRIASVDRNPQLGPGGTVVATVGLDQTDTVTLTTVDAGPERTQRIAVGKPVRDVGFSPDGNSSAPNGAGEVAVWSTTTGERVASLPLGGIRRRRIGFSPDNRSLAVGDADSVKVVNIDRPLGRDDVGHRHAGRSAGALL